MPIYEYACSLCAEHFDVRQGFDAEPVAVCTHCQGEARRVFHSPFIVYKAAGFYTSDQRRDGRGNYRYNKEMKEDQKATKEAKGEAEPASTPSSPPPQEKSTSSSDD